MMDALDGIRSVVGDSAVTNVMLGACVLQLQRVYPYVRALAAHFKLNIRAPRAQTEPGHAE
jgi:hypothetical protein